MLLNLGAEKRKGQAPKQRKPKAAKRGVLLDPIEEEVVPVVPVPSAEDMQKQM